MCPFTSFFKRLTERILQVEGTAEIGDRDKEVLRACCPSLITHLPSQPLFLSGKASYSSIPNSPVPSPAFHTIPFKCCIHV